MKEKIELYLKLMLSNADSQGYLSLNFGELAKAVGVSKEISRYVQKYTEGRAKQRKRINYKKVTEEMVNECYMNYEAHLQRFRKYKDEKKGDEEIYISHNNKLLVESLNEMSRLTNELQEIKKENICLKAEILQIKEMVKYINDITIKLEEYLS